MISQPMENEMKTKNKYRYGVRTILVLLVAGLMVALGATANASSSDDDDDDCYRCYAGTNGINGTNGADGMDGIDGSGFDNSVVMRHTVINTAMLNLTEISHDDSEHAHTNVSVAYGGNNGDVHGFAGGMNHMMGEHSFKVTVGVSGSETAYGAGYGFNLQL